MDPCYFEPPNCISQLSSKEKEDDSYFKSEKLVHSYLEQEKNGSQLFPSYLDVEKTGSLLFLARKTVSELFVERNIGCLLLGDQKL